MASDLNKALLYKDDDYNALLREFSALSTFDRVSQWDARAQAEVDRLVEISQVLESEIEARARDLRQLLDERKERGFFAGLLASKTDEKELSKRISNCQHLRSSMSAKADRLQEMIDFTPNSAEEKAALLAELALRKRELQLNVRALSTAIGRAHSDARRASVEAGTGITALFGSKVVAAQRRQIRLQREAQLRPNESARDAIKRQILAVDRNILWVEKIKA